ncbi:N-acetylmuramidase domain-containing protein [Pedobacter gandavensis]|uniref:N-acetylmuramidase domain-containing protein n=1 Tax=Pedobacter gandavensis TaxID=2679963 RepID=UPI00292D3112|nr:N-acetylmuramidase domain-containing protein [Pedobacter gandavensis]
MILGKEEIKKVATSIGVEYSALIAFIEVESGGKGFASDTGKIIIQFEPSWFKRKVPFAPSGAWSVNGVERQSKEWVAFNDAFSINANGAMESTSIGLGQIMGFHYSRLGYKSVGEMWDDAKRGELQQVVQMARFIATDKRLLTALKNLDWHIVACLYNGAGYLELAKKIGREPYNITLEKAYKKYSA